MSLHLVKSFLPFLAVLFALSFALVLAFVLSRARLAFLLSSVSDHPVVLLTTMRESQSVVILMDMWMVTCFAKLKS